MAQTVVVRAVYDGDKAGSKVIWQGKADDGVRVTEFLDANCPVPEVPGYILDKWWQWDYYGHKFDASTTVRGWTNVYVTYTTDPNYGAENIFVNEGGRMEEYSKPFKKAGGKWVECASFDEAYDPSKKYIPSWHR